MSTMSDPITSFYALTPAKYGYLEELRLSREISEDGCSDYTINLTMQPFPLGGAAKKKLFLTFRGAKDLRIGHLEGLFNLVIEIRDVRDRQLECISYKIVESENNAFSFLCREFDAEVK